MCVCGGRCQVVICRPPVFLQAECCTLHSAEQCVKGGPHSAEACACSTPGISATLELIWRVAAPCFVFFSLELNPVNGVCVWWCRWWAAARASWSWMWARSGHARRLWAPCTCPPGRTRLHQGQRAQVWLRAVNQGSGVNGWEAQCVGIVCGGGLCGDCAGIIHLWWL